MQPLGNSASVLLKSPAPSELTINRESLASVTLPLRLQSRQLSVQLQRERFQHIHYIGIWRETWFNNVEQVFLVIAGVKDGLPLSCSHTSVASPHPVSPHPVSPHLTPPAGTLIHTCTRIDHGIATCNVCMNACKNAHKAHIQYECMHKTRKLHRIGILHVKHDPSYCVRVVWASGLHGILGKYLQC